MARCERCGLLKTGAAGAFSDAHRCLELARKTIRPDERDHYTSAMEKQIERARAEFEKEAAALRAEAAALRPQPPAPPARYDSPPPTAKVRAPFPVELRALARTLKISMPFRRPTGSDPIWSYRPIRDPKPWSVPPPDGGDLFALARGRTDEQRPHERPRFLRERALGHEGWCTCMECLAWLSLGPRPSIH